MKEIPLSQGKVALVDDYDFDYLSKHKWCVQKDRHRFYAVRSIQSNKIQKGIRMHREILSLLPGQCADHINGNGLDNRRSNLRRATISQNGANRRKGSNNTSGAKGVTWVKRLKLWQASICVNGRLVHIGRFKDIEVAARAYKIAAAIIFGAFSGEPQ